MAKHSTVRRSKKDNFTNVNKAKPKVKDAKKIDKGDTPPTAPQPLNRSRFNFHKWRIFVIAGLAIFCSVLNSYHQSSMFENDRHFSHLSTLEREMTFRTEMGLYYSYFKSIIEAPSLIVGLEQIMSDHRTEYPSVINTLERFNLYPEVILGASFRGFTQLAGYLGLPIKECWTVDRGQELTPVESCDGLGDPANFYTTCVFLFNGIVGALMFLYGTFLSDSILGGIISASFFFFNHGECTRVQWTPPLRESFGYPIFLMQMLIVTLIVRDGRAKFEGCVITGMLTAIFILFWQFAQFALLTQVLSLFSVYVLNMLSVTTLQIIIKGQIAGLIVALGFLFGNKMLLTSFFTSTLVSVLIITLLHDQFSKIRNKALRMCLQLNGLLLCSCFVKIVLSFVLRADDDDAHIWNLLRAKFTDFKDFHSMLYLCANEFDFLERETYTKLTKTALLPVGVFIVLVILVQIIRRSILFKDKEYNKDGYILYNVFQLLSFAVMAILVMRLKLFLTPHLCVIASLIVSRHCFRFLDKSQIKYATFVVILSLMAVQGVKNIQYQRDIVGEFSNPQMEQFFTWVNSSTHPDAVFAGPMPIMANLLLSTRRPIVNHPHYENAGSRNRTYQVYKVFSRKSPSEVYEVLREMKINFVVVMREWCYGKSRDGCSMADLWDLEDKENQRNKPLCQRLLQEQPNKELGWYKKVFQNSEFTIFKLQPNCDFCE